MRIVDLESLLWIARLGSFTAAAERQNITQSAMTRRVRELEVGLGVRLFDRVGRRVELTPEGRVTLTYAENIVGLARRMRREVGKIERLTGVVRLGAGELFAAWWLSNFVVRVSRRFPGVTLDLNVDLSVRHVAQFEQKKLDMLLLPGDAPIQGERVLIDKISYAWMASPRLRVPNRVLNAAELAKWPLITLSQDSTNHHLISDWFRRQGVRPVRIDLCNNLRMVGEMVASGLGVALLPQPIFQSLISAGVLQLVLTTPQVPLVPLWAVFDDSSSLPLSALADVAVECHQLAIDQPPA